MDRESPLAQNVRQRMEDKGLGPKALSRKAGLNETYVRDILKGRSRNPRQAHLHNLALALECRVSDLTGEGEPNAPSGELANLIEAYHALTEEQRQALLTMANLLASAANTDAAKPDPPATPEPPGEAGLRDAEVRGRR